MDSDQEVDTARCLPPQLPALLFLFDVSKGAGYPLAMRTKVTPPKLRGFMEELARSASSEGSVYFTGGATALMFGMREQTIDVDIKLDPEPRGIFEALAELKNTLDINIELASPSDFLPVPPDWREQSPFIARHGQLTFYHFDLRAQVLSKIERGHGQDWDDARGFMAHGQITPEQLWSCFTAIKPNLLRYPALDPAGFERKVKEFLGKS